MATSVRFNLCSYVPLGLVSAIRSSGVGFRAKALFIRFFPQPCMDTLVLNTLEFDDRFSIEFLHRPCQDALRVRVTFDDGSDSEASFELPLEELTASVGEAIRRCADSPIQQFVGSAEHS